MRRQPASIIVTADGPDGSLRACIDSLRGALGARDELIVVTRGQPLRSTTSALCVVAAMRATTEELRLLGAAQSSRDIVIFVDGDTVAPPHAVARLVAAFDDPAVQVAVPVCDLSHGRAQVAAPLAAVRSNRTLREYAKAWTQQQRGTSWDQNLVGAAVLAVRRSEVSRVLASGDGRFGCNRNARVLGDLYWHHAGTLGCSLLGGARPFLSATYIVKDEEECLAASLQAVSGFVDEIVVYDTGSTDATVAIAREHGAIVIEGYWNDHFGDARNRSLAHCSGEWILMIDADEVLSGDADALRAELMAASVAVVALTVKSPTGTGFGSCETANVARAGRRTDVWWASRIHEQLKRRDGEAIGARLFDGASILHSGYTEEMKHRKSKSERNNRLARLEAADGVDVGLGAGESQMNRIRSEAADGEMLHALSLAETFWCMKATPFAQQVAANTAARCALVQREFELAGTWVSRLRSVSTTSALCDALDAELALETGDPTRAAQLFAALPVMERHDSGWVVERAHYLPLELRALRETGRLAEAADLVLNNLRNDRVDVPLSGIITLLQDASRDLSDIALAAGDRARVVLLAQTRFARTDTAAELLTAFYERSPRSLDVLVAVDAISERLEVAEAAMWSARMRLRGLGEQCPLIRIARADGRSASDRVVAAALSIELFEDSRGLTSFLTAAELVEPADEEATVARLTQLAPGVAGRLLTAA